jgi:hypothetical protein
MPHIEPMSNLPYVRDQDADVPDDANIDGIPQHEIVLKDPANPRSVYNLVPEPIQKAIDNIQAKYPFMFSQSERQLRQKYHPTETMDVIRIAFWQEYFRVQDNHLPRMIIARIYAGVVHQSMFYQEVLKKPGSVAYMLCPPTSFALTMKAAMNRGLGNLCKMMTMNISDGKGKVDPKAAATFLKAFEIVMNRTEGAVIQKSENKMAVITKNFNEDEAKMKQELEMLRKKYEVVEAKPVSALDVSGEVIIDRSEE